VTCSGSIRRDLRRFGVELLCLLMVLYGAPLQALEGEGGQEDREFDAAPPDPPSSKDDADRDDTARDDATQSAEAAEAFEAAVAAKDHLEGIPLYPGYNLLSLPEEPPDPDPAAVFAPIDGRYVEVFTHDVCDTTDEDGWQRYVPTHPAASDLLAVDPTQGLWIETTAPVVLPSDGTLPATTSWQLCQGWNLIGFPAAQPRPVRSALQSIDGKYVRIFGYDASDSDDPWEIWDVAVPDWANDLRELRPGFGYWLLVTEDVTLEIANEGEPPTVAFTASADLAEVTEPTEVRGSVESQLLDSWSLAYRFAGEDGVDRAGVGQRPGRRRSPCHLRPDAAPERSVRNQAACGGLRRSGGGGVDGGGGGRSDEDRPLYVELRRPGDPALGSRRRGGEDVRQPAERLPG